MTVIEINAQHPEPRKIQRALEAIQKGEVIVYPTDTCYGLGCDLSNKKAIDRLYQIKGIKRSQRLTFVCPNLTEVAKYAIVHDRIYRILKRFLPGPYCFIVEATKEVPRAVQTPQRTVGVRIPNHPVALALVTELGRPIISSTAARHGADPNPDPREIEGEFPGISVVLDAGAGGTTPSTVVDLTGPSPQIVRVGAGDPKPFEA